MKKLSIFLVLLPFFLVQGCEKETFFAENDSDPLTEAVITLRNGDGLEGLIENLYMELEDLMDDGNGPLNPPNANGLVSQLDNIARKLARGQEEEALKMLAAFIEHVNELIADGVLTAEQAAPLLMGADAINDLIVCGEDRSEAGQLYLADGSTSTTLYIETTGPVSFHLEFEAENASNYDFYVLLVTDANNILLESSLGMTIDLLFNDPYYRPEFIGILSLKVWGLAFNDLGIIPADLTDIMQTDFGNECADLTDSPVIINVVDAVPPI